ncbi:hypothetical protein KFE69_04090 [bacterium SCSIO 12844]|nr:hypothetical protein KFE69_04090 [bacterium SCSIO 12844]
MVSALKTASPVSVSEMVKLPEVVKVAAASSVTLPVVSPPMVGSSLVPVMVMVISWVVPSSEVTVIVSVRVSPSPKA